MADGLELFIPPIFALSRRIQIDGSDLMPPSWARLSPGGFAISRPRPRLRPGTRDTCARLPSRAGFGHWAKKNERTETKKKDRATGLAGPRLRCSRAASASSLVGREGRGLLPGRNGYLHSKLHSFSFSFSRSSFMHI